MKMLEAKVGSGFAFLLYYAAVILLALVLEATFEAVAPWLFAGLGVQTGQRTYTQVKLSKNAACPPAEEKKA